MIVDLLSQTPDETVKVVNFSSSLAASSGPDPFFNTSDSQLFEISARLKLVSVPFSSLLLDIGHLA